MPEPLTTREVEHVAKLARLRLSEEQVERYRTQLSDVLAHIAKLGELDVAGVEPMAHCIEFVNRLGNDEPAPAMPLEALLRNAPAVEGSYLAVPKVLDDGGGA
ncbi:MAG TPA: Asp-tRNA(Asn)/Glu-tRNA(Gln) amidotransferase subunit GatC [Phycisphaerales bacterium]|nr:Asp-tRNA(Asn)/Glu-tRNA(Gln) amidotransferase subunit GatC [Phycisphaerales bacterium]HMP37991.1 Asp-tRNA(Asn)/Glu-tRNA(Gln) amidotransferase subunit GatC [Phycisphaerales bacterium]